MNNTVYIYLNNKSFSIEHDAKEQLTVWLDAITSHFSEEQGGAEIVADLKSRMAELLANAGDTVTYGDVANAIGVLGTPEDIFREAGETANETKKLRTDTASTGFGKFVLRVLSIFGGVFLILSAIALLIGPFAFFFLFQISPASGVEDLKPLPFSDVLRFIAGAPRYYTWLICTILLAGLTEAALWFWGVRFIIGRFRIKRARLHYALVGMWIVAVLGIFGTFKTYRQGGSSQGGSKSFSIQQPDTIYLEALPLMKKELKYNAEAQLYYDVNRHCLYGRPDIIYKKSDYFIIEHNWKSPTYGNLVSYDIEVKDSLLIFPPYYTMEPDNRWGCGYLTITIGIPEGTIVVYQRSMDDAHLTLCAEKTHYFGQLVPVSRGTSTYQKVGSDGEGHQYPPAYRSFYRMNKDGLLMAE